MPPPPRDPGWPSEGGRSGNIALACFVVVFGLLMVVLALNVDLSHW